MVASLNKHYKIRQMLSTDVPQAAEIDREAFPTQWPPPSFNSELRNRLAHYMVACEEDDQRNVTSPPPDAEPRLSRKNDGLLAGVKRLLGLGRKRQPEVIQEDDCYVVGVVGFWIMFDEAHIITIAVRNACRRQGIGEMMMIEAIEKAAQLGARVMTLEVRLSNLSAQALYQKYGFKKAGIRPRYYSDNKEDAIIMTTDPVQTPSYREMFQQLKAEHLRKWGGAPREA